MLVDEKVMRNPTRCACGSLNGLSGWPEKRWRKKEGSKEVGNNV